MFEDGQDVGILAAEIDVALRARDGVASDQHSLDEGVGVIQQQHAILEGAGLGFVGIADHITRRVLGPRLHRPT